MSLPREGARVTREGIVMSVPMNWGRSPQAVVPYRVHTQGQIEGASAAGTVRQTDQASYVEGSLIKACYGDEAATGGGVQFGTQGAECEPKTWSKTVKIQDKGVVRHDDEWWMNHKETWGKLTYPKDTKKYLPPDRKEIEPRIQLAQAGAGTMSDAPPIGFESAAPARPQAAAPNVGPAGKLPVTPPVPNTSTPSAMDDVVSVATGAGRGGLMGMVDTVSRTFGFVLHSGERLEKAVSAGFRQHQDELARKEGYKDWDDFVHQARAVSQPAQATATGQGNVRVTRATRPPDCKDLRDEIHRKIYQRKGEGGVNKGILQRREEQINGEFGPGQQMIDWTISDGSRKFRIINPWQNHENEIEGLRKNIVELYDAWLKSGCKDDPDAQVNKKDVDRVTSKDFIPKPSDWKGRAPQ